MKHALWLGLSMMSATPALAAPDAPEADDATRFIVNGKNEKGFPSAVALTFQFGNFSQAFCTGSLVTPRAVLTAGHCIQEIAKQFGVSADQLLGVAYIAFGPDAAAPNRSIQFKSVAVHPDYGNSFAGPTGDVAVIELSEAVEDIQPVWFATEGLDDVAGEDVTSVGYGVISGRASDQRSSGTKRSAVLTISEVREDTLQSDATKNAGNTNVCSGDSGGPQYHINDDGSLVQWAVHSYVVGPQNDICSYQSGSARTDVYSAFILNQIEKIEGSRDRCEIFGQYDDRTCDSDCEQNDPICIADLDGDGEVTDEEFNKVDKDGDGEISEKEADKALKGGCDQTGGLGGFGLLALGGLLAVRRRR